MLILGRSKQKQLENETPTSGNTLTFFKNT